MNKPVAYDVLDNDISDEELQIVGVTTSAENGDCRTNEDNDQVVYTPNEGFTGMFSNYSTHSWCFDCSLTNCIFFRQR